MTLYWLLVLAVFSETMSEINAKKY